MPIIRQLAEAAAELWLAVVAVHALSSAITKIARHRARTTLQ
jgi:hypothetical protein